MTEQEKVPIDMKLEVVVLGVSNVDRAKAFYENLGWRLDIDVAAGDFRGMRLPQSLSPAAGATSETRRARKPVHLLL